MNDIPARPGVHRLPEITAAWLDSIAGFTAWVEAQPNDRFTTGPAGRWSTGQHVDHLIRSVKPLAQGLALPKFVLRLAMGTSDHPSAEYNTILARYEAVLDQGGKASGPYVPPAIRQDQKPALLARHRALGDRVAHLLTTRWDEAALDRHAAKHPLLGKLSLREVLYFSIHHHDHHLQTLQRDYAT